MTSLTVQAHPARPWGVRELPAGLTVPGRQASATSGAPTPSPRYCRTARHRSEAHDASGGPQTPPAAEAKQAEPAGRTTVRTVCAERHQGRETSHPYRPLRGRPDVEVSLWR